MINFLFYYFLVRSLRNSKYPSKITSPLPTVSKIKLECKSSEEMVVQRRSNTPRTMVRIPKANLKYLQ